MRKYRYSKIKQEFVYLGSNTRSVTVRIPDEIYDIINSYEGRSFSDKLRNLVYDFSDQKM